MERGFYIISYDIGNQKRLAKVHNFLKDYGMAVQKSVFECWLSEDEMKAVVSWLSDFIDRKEDRVRIYKLCKTCLKNVEFSGVDDEFTDEPPEELIL